MSMEDFESRLKHLFLESMKGDKASYELFLELNCGLIKRYLSRLGGRNVDPQTIEDLLQEVLIILHEKKQTYQPDKPFLPWIHAICRHRFIDHYRTKKRRPGTVTLDTEIESRLVSMDEEPEHNLEEVLGLLTGKQKEMLMLIKIEGKSYSETAKELSMNVSALKVNVHRIVKMLKGKVNHE